VLSKNRSSISNAEVAQSVVQRRAGDLAGRVKARLRILRQQLEHRDALIAAVREANASVEPQKIAAWLVRRANEWVPAPCWAVVGRDVNDQPTVLAERGLSDDHHTSMLAVANWVMRHGEEFLTAELAKDPRARTDATGTAIAFPLISRHRTIGVLAGLDDAGSSSVPSFGSLAATIRTLLEPAAIAIDNAIALQKAKELSITDDLTQLFNSRYLNLVLRRETKRAFRSSRPLSVVFLDLDGFKNVNDNHGHLAGSKALVEAAGVIRGCARETDVVARFGGDEFALILPDTGSEGAVAVAERIRDRLRGFRFLVSDGLGLRLTASIGVASLPEAATSAEDLLRGADTAMYRVKGSGKDGIHVADRQVS
jgi:diguanylate cyclase (GGDEF)-like protein